MEKYKRIDLSERIKISSFLELRESISAIAKKLGRHRSSIKREVSLWKRYDPVKANEYACRAASMRNGDKRKIQRNEALSEYVETHIRKRWSPVQISNSLALQYPSNAHMQISHESIYTYIYLLGRGELRKELIEGLRQRKKSRYKRKGIYDKRGRIEGMISIEERPIEVNNRSVAGHWEGDLILGKGHKSAIGTIVERRTRALIIVKLEAKDAYSVREAFEKELLTLPQQMRQSMTYDNGMEMSQHKLFTAHTQMTVYFCHPYSPWERGTCENTNGLIRQYFPKGTDFSTVTEDDLKRVQHEINERPRKTLGWKTPKEAFNKEILLICT
jgi:transposase, IS30 family